jgi:PTS system N-acetylglucosamine-specific IIC component
MKYLQKLGKSIMLPVACLPLCGLLMGLGYLLCPASMQGGDISGFAPMVGMFLVKAGGALIDHIALLFAVGIGVGMSDDQNGTAGITALVSWLIIITLLNVDFVRTLMPSISGRPTAVLAFSKIENPFIGILAGLIGAWSYNRFKNTNLPEWLAFFSRKRCTVIISGMVSILVSAALFVIWPVVFGALVKLGQGIASLGYFGAGLYAFFNRLLIPLGLHHALNNVFWFDTIGLGDLTHFWAGHTSADVTWSLGVYMSGFFPCMMFGIPGAVLAIIQSAKGAKRKAAAGILVSAAVCAFVCGITEPFEFAFMFIAPALYVVYSLLYGVFTYITAISGFRAGFSFSAGATDLLFSASLPAAQKTWMIIPLGAAAFVVFYLVFRFMIKKFNLPTPGDAEPAADVAPATTGSNCDVVSGVNIPMIIEGLGGKDNILTLDNCATRLRVELKDISVVDEKTLKQAGAKGMMKAGKTGVQVIIGLKVQSVADASREYLKQK